MKRGAERTCFHKKPRVKQTAEYIDERRRDNASAAIQFENTRDTDGETAREARSGTYQLVERSSR